MHKIAVLIPCYNEALTVAKVVTDFRAALPEAKIYVYDNNSTDGTDGLARAAGACVRYEHRQGKGNVLRTMFRDIEADCYLLVDGDDTYDARHARAMCDAVLAEGADMVIGDRLSSTYFQENKRPLHNFGNQLVRRFINALWHPSPKIMDVMTGYRACSALFVKSFPVLSAGFEIETEMTVHALDNNFALRSMPIIYRDRPSGSVSKLHTFADGWKVLLTIFNLYRYYKPLKFFGSASLLLILCALFFFVPVFVEYLQTGLVPRFPTLIVSGFSAVAAILALMGGLILDTHAKNQRKNMEIKMNIIKLLLQGSRKES